MMPKVVVFVGIDGTGKTPMINLIKGFRNAEYRRVVDNPLILAPDEAINVLTSELADWDTMPGEHLVLYDRLPYPDEYVYGSDITEEQFAIFEEALSANADVRYVYMHPYDAQHYRKLMADHPDEYFDTHNLETYHYLTERYFKWMRLTRFPVLTVYWHPDVPYGTKIAEEVLRYIDSPEPLVFRRREGEDYDPFLRNRAATSTTAD